MLVLRYWLHWLRSVTIKFCNYRKSFKSRGRRIRNKVSVLYYNSLKRAWVRLLLNVLENNNITDQYSTIQFSKNYNTNDQQTLNQHNHTHIANLLKRLPGTTILSAIHFHSILIMQISFNTLHKQTSSLFFLFSLFFV